MLSAAKIGVGCFKSWNKREKNETYFNFSERSNGSPKVNRGTASDFFHFFVARLQFS